MEILAFDGTRLRSKDRKTGTRTHDELREAKAELAQKFTELEAKLAAVDEQDVEHRVNQKDLSKEMAGIERRRQQSHRETHAAKMAAAEAQAKYSRHRHPGEPPFAVAKHEFGARRLLLRGLNQVKQERQWITTAFNLT